MREKEHTHRICCTNMTSQIMTELSTHGSFPLRAGGSSPKGERKDYITIEASMRVGEFRNTYKRAEQGRLKFQFTRMEGKIPDGNIATAEHYEICEVEMDVPLDQICRDPNCRNTGV